MSVEMLQEVFLPFLGTTLGAASVFFIKGRLTMKQQKIYNSFGAGLMAAASIFSLLLPALEGAKQMGRMSFIPAVMGFWIGILFFAGIDRSMRKENVSNKKQSITTMILALVLHNIPEGMAVGVVYAGAVTEKTELTITGAFILSLGIAIQNFPEGAMISVPIYERGVKKGKAFIYGMLSGAVEPFAAVLAILMADVVVPILPYLLGFAAGAMLFVVIEEFREEMSAIWFLGGFTVMLILNVIFA